MLNANAINDAWEGAINADLPKIAAVIRTLERERDAAAADSFWWRTIATGNVTLLRQYAECIDAVADVQSRLLRDTVAADDAVYTDAAVAAPAAGRTYCGGSHCAAQPGVACDHPKHDAAAAKNDGKIVTKIDGL